MRYIFVTVTCLWPVFAMAVHSADTSTPNLPFDPAVVSRLSLDGKPRSLAIRQGTNVWLGYDLERATLMKAWQSPANKPGLVKSGFVTRSAGTAWYEDSSDNRWEWTNGERTSSPTIRYLGCSQRQDNVELKWELRHDTGLLLLQERIPLDAAPEPNRVLREVRVESLKDGESLLPPSAVRKSWKISASPPETFTEIKGSEWYRLTLP